MANLGAYAGGAQEPQSQEHGDAGAHATSFESQAQEGVVARRARRAHGGDSAQMAYGSGSSIALIRERGAWKIRDF